MIQILFLFGDLFCIQLHAFSAFCALKMLVKLGAP